MMKKARSSRILCPRSPVPATIQTTTHLIRGNLHVRRDQRIKDELDINENFLAMTDVSVLGPDGQTLFQAPFLASGVPTSCGSCRNRIKRGEGFLMATPIASNFTRLTSADLLKFKRYLIENVGRSMEGEQLQLGDRAEFMKQRLQEVYVQTKVTLPEDIRKQIFHDILDETDRLWAHPAFVG